MRTTWSAVILLVLSSATQAAEYHGTVGPGLARAQLEFQGDSVSGALCVEDQKLSLKHSVYVIRGRNPSGEVSGDLLSKNQVVGHFAAKRSIKDDNIYWTGHVIIGTGSMTLSISRPKDNEQIAVERHSHFGPGSEAGIVPDQLNVVAQSGKIDAALSYLHSLSTISAIAPQNPDEFSFIYDTYIDDCTRAVKPYFPLRLTVDEFKLKETYDELVRSNLFVSVVTEAEELGPDSIEVPVPRNFLGSPSPSEAQISSFLGLIVERYFRQVSRSAGSCKKHDGNNILASLDVLPAGNRDEIEIDPLEPSKFYMKRFLISGLSRNLIFGLTNHWEKYKLEIRLYPDFQSTNYKLEVTLPTGEIAPFQEASAPPPERYKPIDDKELTEFMQKYTACISQYVNGGCPNLAGAWGVNPYCSRPQ